MTDHTTGDANFPVLINIASELERIANRLEEPMTQPMKHLLGELREMNQHLSAISTEIYRVHDRHGKFWPIHAAPSR